MAQPFMDEAADLIEAQAAEITRLRGALAPFAKEGGDSWPEDCFGDSFVPMCGTNGTDEPAAFTVGDLRRAAAVLKEGGR